MFDAGKSAVEALTGELTKRPHELPPEKLKQAEGLANIFTILRQVVYFVMPIFGIMAAIVYANRTYDIAPYIFTTVLWILFVIYISFKTRDLLRGKI